MQGYDIVMVAILAAAALFGAWKGFAWQVASFASIVVSYFVSCEFRQQLATQINVDPPWNTFVAMLILFLGSSLGIWLVFGMVRSAINRMRLKEFDRQAGFLLGLAKGVVLCVIATLFGVTLLGETQRQAIIQSKSGYYIARLLDESETLMPREVHDFLGPYIQRLDEAEGRIAEDPDAGDSSFPADGQKNDLPGQLIDQGIDRLKKWGQDNLPRSSNRPPAEAPRQARQNDEFNWSPRN